MSGLQCLTGARLLTEAGLLEDRSLLIADRHILGFLPPAEQPPAGAIERRCESGAIIAPGFIDVQVNGGGGVLFNEEPTAEAALRIASAHRRFGTTTLLPTIITDRPAVMHLAAGAVRNAMAQAGSGVGGLHLEGPFISPRRPGVHDPALIRRLAEADLAWLAETAAALPLLITLAPEEAEVQQLRRLVAAGAILSAGHTAATAEEIADALAVGLCGFTHLFNAMPPLAGREPGPVGAALADQSAWAGLVVDGIHVHPLSLKLALAARPEERMILVTDAMSVQGTDADNFMLYGARILRRDGRLVREDGTLAGADLDMAQAVRNTVSLLGLPIERALRMASAYPAALMRFADRGRVAPGLRADLVLLSEGLEVIGTWVGGQYQQA